MEFTLQMENKLKLRHSRYEGAIEPSLLLKQNSQAARKSESEVEVISTQKREQRKKKTYKSKSASHNRLDE
jgi:hypothetical protein